MAVGRWDRSHSSIRNLQVWNRQSICHIEVEIWADIQCYADAIFRSKCCTHFSEQRSKVCNVLRFPTSDCSGGEFPVEIRSLKSPRVHELDQGGNKCSSVGCSRAQSRPCCECWPGVAEIKTADSNPGLHDCRFECSKLGIQSANIMQNGRGCLRCLVISNLSPTGSRWS
jgi:hypothetical protein